MDLYWNQQLLDVLFEYPIGSDRSAFSIQPRLARLGLRVVTTLQFLPPAGAARAFEFHGDPGLVRLDPSWHQAALRFVELGFLHILDGTDHLLFLLCLVIPFRRFGPLILIVTAFTVAHSITLIASAFGFAPDALWFPPLIETLIAVSIVYMALENIVGSNLQRRWMITFAFGLVHGFGFLVRAAGDAAVRRIAPAHVAAGFNVGVELGQLLVIVVLVPMLGVLFRLVPETHRDDHPVGARRAYRVALDARARRAAASVSVAGARRRLAGERDALADGDPDLGLRAGAGQSGVAARAMAGTRMTNGPAELAAIESGARASLGLPGGLPSATFRWFTETSEPERPAPIPPPRAQPDVRALLCAGEICPRQTWRLASPCTSASPRTRCPARASSRRPCESVVSALDAAQDAPVLPIHAREANVLGHDFPGVAGVETQAALERHARPPVAAVLAPEQPAFQRMHAARCAGPRGT